MRKRRQTPALAELERRLRRLARSLGKTGLVLQGSINQVRLEPVRPGAKPRGPYYLWTWKLKAKTHTAALSKAQVGTFQKAIDNHRQMKQIIAKMRKISLEICNLTTHGVKKRKPPKKA